LRNPTQRPAGNDGLDTNASKEKWKMLNMKWMTDHDDRLVATWTHSDPAATTVAEGKRSCSK